MSALGTRSGLTRRDVFGVQNAGVFYALILIVGGFTISTSLAGNSTYFSIGNLESVLQQSSIVGLLAIFTTIVLITGNFDLSIASTAALTSVVAIRLGGQLPMPLLVMLCLGIGVAIGSLNAVLVVGIRVNAFIATLGTQQVVRGIVYLAAGQISVLGQVQELRAMTNTPIAISTQWVVLAAAGGLLLAGALRYRSARAGADKPTLAAALLIGGALVLVLGIVVPAQRLSLYSSVYIMLGVGVLAWVFMRYTVAGRRLYAVGSNREAALLSGIRVGRYQSGAFIANGVAAAFAGLMIAGQYQAVDPTVFSGQEFVAITGAILGGVALFGGAGDVLKAIVGAVIVIALGNGLNFQNVSSSWQYVVQGAALVVAAAIYTFGGNPDRRAKVRSRFGRRRTSPPSAGHTSAPTEQSAGPQGDGITRE